jgi:hypothetical protein
LAERRISLFWIVPGQRRKSTSLQSLLGPGSESPLSLTIGSGVPLGPGDDPKHELVVLAIYRATTTSSDPNLNESELIAYQQADEVAGTGTQRGYFRRLYKDGDTDYGTYEGTHKTSFKEDGSWEATTWEVTWKSIGGTGKFKNIKGSGTARGKATAQEALEEFEGEVEY